MNRIKRMPIFYPFFMIINAFVLIFVYFPKWLVGYWYCEDCQKWQGVNDEQFSTQHADICKTCYENEYGGNDMTPYEKEVLYTMRNAEGMITDVYDIETGKYLKVTDTAITIDSSAPSEEELEEQSSRFAKGLHAREVSK